MNTITIRTYESDSAARNISEIVDGLEELRMLLSDIMDEIDDDSDAFDLVESAQFEVENASDSLRTAVEILEMEADLED